MDKLPCQPCANVHLQNKTGSQQPLRNVLTLALTLCLQQQVSAVIPTGMPRHYSSLLNRGERTGNTNVPSRGVKASRIASNQQKFTIGRRSNNTFEDKVMIKPAELCTVKKKEADPNCLRMVTCDLQNSTRPLRQSSSNLQVNSDR